MEKYQVTIGLKNGKEYSFFAYSDKGSKIIFDSINNKLNGDWFSFIDIQGYNRHSINKDEISSITFSLTDDEMKKHENDIEEKEKRINK